MSDRDPAERWSELDESTRPRARSRRPSDPDADPRPAPERTRPSEPRPQPVTGPSPYEAYPWEAVGGSPLSPTQPPYPTPSPYGVGAPGGFPVPYPAPGPVRHPSASVALTLGLVGTIGGAACWAPVIASPVALAVGLRALREIDTSGGTLAGRGAAKAGAVLGGLGTLALVGLVLALIVVVAS